MDGWVSEGGFCQLFNSMRSDMGTQIRGILPEDFEAFTIPANLISGPHERIHDRYLFSHTIKDFSVSGGAVIGYEVVF